MSALSFLEARGTSTDQTVLDLSKQAVTVLAGTVAGVALSMIPLLGGATLMGGALFSAISTFCHGCIKQGILKIYPDLEQTVVKTTAIFATMCLSAIGVSMIGFPINIISVVIMTAAIHFTARLLQNRSMGY